MKVQRSETDDDVHTVHKFSWDVRHLYDRVLQGGYAFEGEQFSIGGIKFKLVLNSVSKWKWQLKPIRLKRCTHMTASLIIDAPDEEDVPTMWWRVAIHDGPAEMVFFPSHRIGSHQRGQVKHRKECCHPIWKPRLRDNRHNNLTLICWLEVAKGHGASEDVKKLYSEKLMEAKMGLLGAEDDDVADVSLLDKEGKSHYCHRSLLCAISPTFAQTLPQLLDRVQVEMKDAESAQVETLIQLMYGTKMKKLSEDEAAALLPIVHRYGIEELKDQCQEILSDKMDVKRAIKYMELANKHEADVLKRSIIMYMQNNLNKMTRDPEWIRLKQSKPSVVLDYFLPNHC